MKSLRRWDGWKRKFWNILGCFLFFFFFLFLLIISLFRFKSNPNLVSAFEARKLPRAFLVLLENLLNKTPSIRPSSERVATAIREGKVCCKVFQLDFLIF